MTNAKLVDIVRQQLAVGTSPTAEQTEALLLMIDTLQAELASPRPVTAQEQPMPAPLQMPVEPRQALKPLERAVSEEDRTKRKQLQLLLQESEARYRMIADLILDYAYIIRIEPDGRAISEWIADTFTRSTGYSREEIDAICWRVLIHPDDLATVEDRVQQLREGQRVETEFRIITKSGEVRWLSDYARAEWDATQGRVVRILGVASDITERKRAEQRLQVLAQASALLNASLNYEKTLDQVAHLAVPFLADGCFVDLLANERSPQRLIIAHANPDKERLLRELSELYPIGAEWPHLFNDMAHAQKPVLIANLSETICQSISLDETQRNLLQQLNFRSAMIVPLSAHERMFGTMMFVSEQENHQYGPNDLALAEELASRAAMAFDNVRLYAEAQAAVEARDEFLSIAAHELKTPTAALLSATNLLRTLIRPEQGLNERIQHKLEIISLSSQRLNKLIDALTEFARIQIGQFTLTLQPVMVCSLVRQILSELPPTSHHYVALSCADESLTIQGDALRLEQVLYNLVQNAIKYSPGGGPITVRIEQSGDHVLIRVKDQGIGIPEAARSQLFQRFYRASNAIRQHISGMGIGLYLVKEIVTRHGGDVEVSSIEGYGSTFTVRLPLIQESPT